MIVLYIFLGLIAFILLMTAFMILVPLKIYIKGTYWDKKPTGQMDIYWVKYFVGTRLRIKDLEHIHILIWFLGIPIPIRFPLSVEKIKKKNKSVANEPRTSENVSENVEDKKLVMPGINISHISRRYL